MVGAIANPMIYAAFVAAAFLITFVIIWSLENRWK